MATRAATFTAKIRNLKDYHHRMVNNVSPQTSGVDVANTLKYFSQTLLSVLKDVPFVPSESYGPHRHRDNLHLSLFPSLNYSGLYEAVIHIVDVVPTVQYGQHALGESILTVIGCLVPFLEYELLDMLPYAVASTLATFPPSLQRETVQILCNNLLPVVLGHDGVNENPTYATESAAHMLMMVFQYIENGEYHSQVLESLMSMKTNICKDILSVIAYGPPSAKAPAVNHLFYYWPQLNPALSDRRGIHYKYQGWIPTTCQREDCPNAGNVRAVKMCLDPVIAVDCADQPPPLYLCADCVDQVRGEHERYLVDTLQPLHQVALLCENKNCTAPKNTAVCTCFSIECASMNGFRPVRYCSTCHSLKHGTGTGLKHITHSSLPNIWTCDPQLQGYLVEAVVSLLKEAQPLEEKRTVEMGEERARHHAHFEEEEHSQGEEADERKLLSRYGIWLMVELCPPQQDISIEILGRLLAMLFQWFDATAYLPDDNVGNALERLKPEYVYKWLQEVKKLHFEVVLSCLLPHPPEYARVGGYWDTLASRTSQIKEGLNRLSCLVPYDIVSFEVWDYVMPFWLEAIRTEVPDSDRHELKVLLCKTFDTDMSPMPFTVDKVYNFLTERFDKTTAPVQEQNLCWMQIMSQLEILIPLDLLINMFISGVNALLQPPPKVDTTTQPPTHQPIHNPALADETFPLGSPLSPSNINGVFNFDNPQQSQGTTLHNQNETQSQTGGLAPGGPNQGQTPDQAAEPAPDEGPAEEDVPNITCLIMMLDVLLRQLELQEVTPHQGLSGIHMPPTLNLLTKMLSLSWDGTHTCLTQDDTVECTFCEVGALWHQLAAQVLEYLSPKDPIKLPEKDLPPVDSTGQKIRPRTLSEPREKKNSAENLKVPKEPEPELTFDLTQLPGHLQLLHSLLLHLDTVSDADALYFLLRATKLLVLHSECINVALHAHEDFVHHCIKKLLMPNLWKLTQAEHSQIASMCMPILLYCITLPHGADIFWDQVEDDFGEEDWKVRFAAVEKVTMLARLVDVTSIHQNQQLRTALAHSFCYLISSLSDLNSSVVQRSTIYLETIKESSIKCVCQCLEFQFDSVISDRSMILHKLMMLGTVLKDSHIFSWEFFLNRFDTLCLEAQLDLESTIDVASLQDLHSSDRQSDHFLRKINRARFALARTDSIRSVSGSLYAKPPYRRAASVPMHLLARTLPPQSNTAREKDKSPYTRQQSAPQFRSRGSRFGTSMFSNYMFPCGRLREFTDEESNFAALLQRAMDMEGVDRETLHHLVMLLMKFMVHSNQEDVNADRNTSKAQNIVLRHLNVLLGYNQTEKAFSVPPYKLRYSAVFNAYISGLPQVLDRNFPLGNLILPVCMQLLQYCPSPQRYASDYQPPNYTLWYLEPHTRQSWLTTLLVILYKYQYNTNPASDSIQTLIRLVINTIDAQLHRCKRYDDTFGPSSPIVPRTRDTSNVSIGDLENILETDTPPQSPTDSQPSVGDTVTISLASPTTTTVHYKKRAESEKTEETDLESLSPTSKVATPSPKVISPVGRPQSPPLPTSPTSSLSFSLPSISQRSGKTGRLPSPTDSKGLPGSESMVMISGNDQPRRIAEYHHRSSLTDSMPLNVSRPAHTLPAPMVKQRTEPALKYKPFKQHRTLEQSVEEYMMGQVGIKSQSGDLPDHTPGGTTSPMHNPQDVDRKIAQQIEEFELHSESKRKAANTDVDEEKHVATWEKPPHSLGLDRFETVLEEVRETEEEWDSPQRTQKRTSLSKTVSADIAPATSTDVSPEFSGTQNQRRGRALSERTVAEDLEIKVDTQQTESDLDESPCPSPGPQPRIKPQFRQRKQRKTGLTTVELQKMIPELGDLASSSGRKSPNSRRSRRSEISTKTGQSSQKRSVAALRASEQVMVDRCHQCHVVLEQYDEDTIGLCIICLATFIHREPALAAPLLLDMLQSVARIAASSPYPWQSDVTGLIIPGNSVSVARQFLRCVLHQLAPNSIFPQLFTTHIEDPDFLKTIAAALLDFSELNCYTALQMVLEGVNEMKTLTQEQVIHVLSNVATYIDYITLETSSPVWNTILANFEVFFRRLPSLLVNPMDMGPVLRIIIAVLKIPGLPVIKAILDPFSKLLAFTIQKCSFKLQQLNDICSLCSRAFSKERDKLFLSRCIIFELTQALKFKTTLPDDNLLLLVQFLCVDSGGTLGPTNIVEELANYTFNPYSQSLISTSAADCMKQHLGECMEFIADLHTITRIKSNVKGCAQNNLNEDTLGSLLKTGIAQYVALELSRANGRDNRAISRYLPWLYHPPSSIQQGPREFTDCVGHTRLLSWLLLGALIHTAITKGAGTLVCQPLPLETSNFIADHIMVILTGFAEQSKTSVLHMSSLFHTFMLCQLWTMYCESCGVLSALANEGPNDAQTTIMDFWARITPGILQLLSHSKVLAEMVNLHFLSLIEALQECNSMVLAKLFPLWIPILFSYHNQLPGHMQVRLQMTQNWQPRNSTHQSMLEPDTLLKWLRRLQFKLGQIEVQSSAAAQFYTV